ncbi:MAG: YIP1 family protein [Gammaproteobacteria bacterium]|jgi:hypothetical protein|nr:YIP1 family protein [Gammaproteobacteria bacterium]MBT3859649.1 YIP1 family protein [Gammaproteobacteria bacterium]MBT3987622.1 YIP1 family protein [Gammaproteobacteria bacterium]MBT4254767.1 YIP1 family protein [Gammaproteobacteria bacterium]MBT4581638.1 YIP1 family protein [Gammaproteobacteria bacterium]
MTDSDALQSLKTEPAGYFTTAINILTSPTEAFDELNQRPTKLFPLALITISTMIVMFWYFSIVDFDWYIDDSLSGANLNEEQLEAGREAMQSMSQSTFKMFGVFGGAVGVLVIYLLQSGYLSMASALAGDRYKFRHWFSLVLWAGLPSLLSVIGMAVNIALSPNGQLSAYDLNPLTLANLGMQSDIGSLTTVMNSLDLTMIWSITLVVMAYKHWLGASISKTLAIVLAPYLLIFGILAYFAVT